MRKGKVLLGMAVGLFCLTLVAASCLAAPIEIKLGHVDPADVCISKKGAAGATFKGLAEGGSGGNVNVKVFPASQLGNERELIEGVKIGTIQMAFVSGAGALEADRGRHGPLGSSQAGRHVFQRLATRTAVSGTRSVLP